MGPNKSSGAKGGKVGKGGGKGGKGKSKANYYSSRRPVGGKGIFVTTVRGKESRCAGEMYDLLDEVSPTPSARLCDRIDQLG
jgi:tRNA acetyltransferase TAN1